MDVSPLGRQLHCNRVVGCRSHVGPKGLDRAAVAVEVGDELDEEDDVEDDIELFPCRLIPKIVVH